ncbi:LADA_0E01750g1_1 [Lachancea dasiensis]|uniref:LADA_0E01750g1_1 n=1 Tax=Lachancea dasiensis TaxID=1072105 RepID=A0A1G4JB78_9SACH|nr:LADA_0E01750g1_1 [Lachancea dasiensis]
MKPAFNLMNKLPYKSVVDLAFHHVRQPSTKVSEPLIVNLHGLFGSARSFGALGKRLANDLNTDVFNVDLRNHGRSPLAKPYDYLTLTRDLVHLLHTTVGEKRPIAIMGFSLGGKVALMSALSRKINVVKCISIDMPPYHLGDLSEDIKENFNTIQSISNRLVKIKKGSKNWKESVLSIFRNLPVNCNPGTALYFAQGFLEVKGNSKLFDPSTDMDPYINYRIPRGEMTDILEVVKKSPNINELDPLEFRKSTTVPVLFMRALKSPLFVNSNDGLSAHFPNFTLKEFNTGHSIVTEAPTEFYKSCLKHLSAE